MIFILSAITGLILPLAHARDSATIDYNISSTFVTATVRAIESETKSVDSGYERTVQQVVLHVNDGEQKGKILHLENGILGDRKDMELAVGDRVIVEVLPKAEGGEPGYLIRESYRLPSVFWLIVGFLALALLCGGWVAIRSITGLLVSVGILLYAVVPGIIAGWPPLPLCLAGAFGIALLSLTSAHGWNKRTSVALWSTMLTLVLAVLLAQAAVAFTHLFGMGSEEATYLELGVLSGIDLHGLLLGGIIIGALGVLDDITTAQAAALDELSRANHAYGVRELLAAGKSIGREHMASLINTLALAYVGSSLPLLLLFHVQRDHPWWVILSSEMFVEEIVRTLVGSATLLLAVPITNWIAAKAFAHGRHSSVRGHSHHH